MTQKNFSDPKRMTKEERLAAALRENLLRRKAQARAREGDEAAVEEGGADEGGLSGFGG